MSHSELIIQGARQNNLNNINLTLPHNKLISITGVSGSGKSSLAFDTIFAEGQWRFIESLSTYARLFIEKLDRPDVDAIYNIRPAIALEQKNPVKSSRSTVGTLTEIYDVLRIIFSKISVPVCPKCNITIHKWNVSAIKAYIIERYSNHRAAIMFKSNSSVQILKNRGFHRLWVNNSFARCEDFYEDFNEPKFVVVDRLQIADDARLSDSLETAWTEGNGTLSIILFADETEPEIINFSETGACDTCGYKPAEASALMFSFNHPLGACNECKGFGYLLVFNDDLLIPEKTLSIADGAITIWQGEGYSWWQQQMIDGLKKLKIDIHTPYDQLSDEHKQLLFEGCNYFYGINSFFQEIEAQKYKLHVRVLLSRLRCPVLCPKCKGSRLSQEALVYRIEGKNIADVADMNFKQLKIWLDNFKLSAEQLAITHDALALVSKKLNFLLHVGLGYLSLNRQTKTLSGGEYQRVNLSNQLGSALTGSIYVLDEPTIGLHPRDTQKVIEILRKLVLPGNTVIVVEHDADVIRNSDWIVELGVGGGSKGGNVVFSGSISDFVTADTLTANYLQNKPMPIDKNLLKDVGHSKSLIFNGCKGHNLKNISVNIPIDRLTVVTGVSGSGKSSLVVDTIYAVLAKHFKIEIIEPLPYDEVFGVHYLSSVNLVDQRPIAKTPRSNLMTYIKVFEPIRKVFASQPEAKTNGLTASFFSFNTPGGRCEVCKGEGFQKLEMYFFEDVYAKCEVCKGKRYKEEPLRIKYKGKNIYDVFELNIDDAITFFEDIPDIVRKLRLLQDIGLGYLRLGQSANTFSGGEAQRLKICNQLLQNHTNKDLTKTLYILDEPTVGLHGVDIIRLMQILKRIVASGNPVILIEHNLDVIAMADWIIDLGPEGGDEGGYLIYEGTVQGLLNQKNSYTAQYLRQQCSCF